jgi:hypothetical protein
VKVSTATKDGLGEVGKFGFVEASLDDSFARAEFLAKKAMALACSALAVAAALPLASRGLLV